MDSETIPKMTAAAEMSQKVTEAHVDFMEFLLSGKLSSRDKVSGIMGNLESQAQEHLRRETETSEEKKNPAEELLKKTQLFSSAIVEVMDMKTRGLSDEDLLSAEEKTVRPIYDNMMALLAKQNESYKAELSGLRKDVKDSQDRGLLIIVIIAVIAMITGIILSIFYGRLISRPIVNLTTAAEDISKGDISKPVVKETNDEIGELAEAFERMRISLKVMIEEEG
jgi:methyl-accepting chemotaxis protein